MLVHDVKFLALVKVLIVSAEIEESALVGEIEPGPFLLPKNGARKGVAWLCMAEWYLLAMAETRPPEKAL